MASAVHFPVSEYLSTSYRPDREYIDGELVKRNVGKWEHSRVQWLLAGWFLNHEREWNVIGSTGQRICISPTRIRIPDLVVLRPGPQPDVLTEPPLLVIEILSPDDTYSALQQRCQDFLGMGVGCIWIIDPATRSGRMCSGDDWLAAPTLRVPGTEIALELESLFARLHEPASQG